MRITTNKQNRDVHAATVEEQIVHRIIAERVAEKLGVSLDGEGVTWRAYHSTRDTSTGIRHDVVVEIIDDHTAKPGVVAA
jgi:hypothetical protein